MAPDLEDFQRTWGENKAWAAARKKYGAAALKAIAKVPKPSATEAKELATLENAIDAHKARKASEPASSRRSAPT